MYVPENMEMAVMSVYSGLMSQNQASRKFGVPQTTISLRISKLKKKLQAQVYKVQQ